VVAGSKLQTAGFCLWMLGLFLAVVGYFGPWVPHETSALTVTGSELSWFVKFFPQVWNGALTVRRELFATPLIASAVLLALLVRSLSVRPSVRLGGIGVALLIVLAALPLYDPPLSPEYRSTLILMVVGAVLVLLTLLVHWLPGWTGGILLALLTIAGIVPALWQFARVRPLVAALYGQPVGLGWGLILCVVGFALLLIRAVLAIASSARPAQSAS
jgi:hypothetical protein